MVDGGADFDAYDAWYYIMVDDNGEGDELKSSVFSPQKCEHKEGAVYMMQIQIMVDWLMTITKMVNYNSQFLPSEMRR